MVVCDFKVIREVESVGFLKIQVGFIFGSLFFFDLNCVYE